VIAGYDGNTVGGAELRQDKPGLIEFRRKRNIDQIAGDRRVIGGLAVNVRDQPFQHSHLVDFPALESPGEKAGDPLTGERNRSGARQGADMQVRDVRERNALQEKRLD
jgi:hypothetical protein